MITNKDIRQYVKLRRCVRNAWHVARRRHDRTGELAVKLRSGITLHLRGACQDYTTFDRIFLRDEYHLKEYEAEVHGTVVDLGANVGIFAARIAPQAARVICYEPMQSNFSQLEKNLGGLAHVTRVHAAVGDAGGTARIFQPRDTRISGGFTQYPHEALHAAEGYEEMPIVTLDQVFAQHDIRACDLLKVDTEGAEYAILYGASDETLARIRRISGEYHRLEHGGAHTHIKALCAHLSARGFVVTLLPKRGMENHGLFFAARSRP